MSVVLWAGKKTDGAVPDDSPAQIAAGLTFVCDRRVEVLDEFPMNLEGTDQQTFIPMGVIADRRLVSPLQVDDPTEAFKQLCAQMASLNGSIEVAISTAIRLHYGAVLLFDRDLAAAYTLLVAGVETLSREFGSPPTDWAAWDGAAHWDKFIRKNGLSDAQGAALRADLMKDRQLRLKQTFVNYVVERLPEDFWSLTWQDYLYTVDIQTGHWSGDTWEGTIEMRNLLPEDNETLIGCLRKTYDARSSFVHAGQRIITVIDQIRSLIKPTSPDQPLSFAALRSILTTLIQVELGRHSTEYELPDLRMTHG